MTDAELEELEALRKPATAQPWFYEPHGDTGYCAIGFGFEQGDTSLSNPINGEVDMFSERPFVAEAVAVDVNGQANARLIVSAVNALPSLLSTIRTLKAEVEKRDQVVEAARFARTLLAGLKAFRDDGDLQVMGDALQRLETAVTALDQEGTP